jgi:hypothetical protein
MTLYQASLTPVADGSGRYTVGDYRSIPFRSIRAFERFMSTNYYWRWAPELTGRINDQKSGRPLTCIARNEPLDSEWSYYVIDAV